MITVKNIDELKEFYEAGFKDNLVGICENCSKTIKLKSWSIKRKLSKDKLLCKACSVSYEKRKYTDEEKLKIQEKRKKTNMKKYGVENTYQLEKVKTMS